MLCPSGFYPIVSFPFGTLGFNSQTETTTRVGSHSPTHTDAGIFSSINLSAILSRLRVAHRPKWHQKISTAQGLNLANAWVPFSLGRTARYGVRPGSEQTNPLVKSYYLNLA